MRPRIKSRHIQCRPGRRPSIYESPLVNASHSGALRKNSTYGIGGSTGAGPEITSLLLALASAVGLPNNVAAKASRQDLVAVGSHLDVTLSMCLRVAGEGEGADGEESKDGDGGELHLE